MTTIPNYPSFVPSGFRSLGRVCVAFLPHRKPVENAADPPSDLIPATPRRARSSRRPFLRRSGRASRPGIGHGLLSACTGTPCTCRCGMNSANAIRRARPLREWLYRPSMKTSARMAAMRSRRERPEARPGSWQAHVTCSTAARPCVRSRIESAALSSTASGMWIDIRTVMP
jgi:hypothetical protein